VTNLNVSLHYKVLGSVFVGRPSIQQSACLAGVCVVPLSCLARSRVSPTVVVALTRPSGLSTAVDYFAPGDDGDEQIASTAD